VRRQRELIQGTTAHAGAGLSFLPGVLGFQFGNPLVSDDAAEQLSPEQVQQAFLSRLLLLLGSFVILCLLLF
jgi:E3 ubiquitin-protein ligase RNF5